MMTGGVEVSFAFHKKWQKYKARVDELEELQEIVPLTQSEYEELDKYRLWLRENE